MESAPPASILVSVTPSPPAPPPLIRTPPATGQALGGRRWQRLLPAWILSGLFHAGLILIFMEIHYDSGLAQAPPSTEVVETRVEEAPNPMEALDNPDVGLDPEVPTNFNVTRIEEISVPGPAAPDEAVGVLNAPAATPTNIPPPPGLGKEGQGGGVDGLPAGVGNLVGFSGGLGKLALTPGGFGGRSGATRARLVRTGGGNAQSEAAVALGLHWLFQHQAPDGRWSLDGFHRYARCNCGSPGQANDVAGTAFGLLPFLGAGYTHRAGPGKDGKYAKSIERGLKFLLLQQNREGAFNGNMYAQGLATIAVCEAYGLTADPALQKPAQRALQYIARAQNERGGWDYTPRGPTPDTSIGGWQIMAMKSGQMAGLDVSTATLAKATHWLDEWAGDPEGSLYGYRQPRFRNPEEGGASPQSMIAIGLLCRQYLGWGPRHPGLNKGARWLLLPANMPLPGNRSHMYFHYYATQVMHHMGGDYWKRWNPAMRDWLIRTQDQGLTPRHAHQKGSWEAKGDWWCAPGGRVMMTSLCLLTLEVYYRHLPLYRRNLASTK